MKKAIKREGLIFIDIITALFVIGLMVVVVFPIFALTQESFTQHKNTAHMSYLSESTIEKLKLKDEEALAFLEELEKHMELKYPHLQDEDYSSTVKLLSDSDYLWDISVTIRDPKNIESYVELRASIAR